MIDDGEKLCRTVHLIGVLLIEALNDLDRAKLLGPSTPTSPIKDIGLVISRYLYWAKDLEGSGVDEPEHLEWRKHAIAYAKRGGIDLVKEGCVGMAKVLERYEKKYGTIRALKDAPKSVKTVRWKWKKFVSGFFLFHLSLLFHPCSTSS